jgi:hypothetical protein
MSSRPTKFSSPHEARPDHVRTQDPHLQEPGVLRPVDDASIQNHPSSQQQIRTSDGPDDPKAKTTRTIYDLTTGLFRVVINDSLPEISSGSRTSFTNQPAPFTHPGEPGRTSRTSMDKQENPLDPQPIRSSPDSTSWDIRSGQIAPQVHLAPNYSTSDDEFRSLSRQGIIGPDPRDQKRQIDTVSFTLDGLFNKVGTLETRLEGLESRLRQTVEGNSERNSQIIIATLDRRLAGLESRLSERIESNSDKNSDSIAATLEALLDEKLAAFGQNQKRWPQTLFPKPE